MAKRRNRRPHALELPDLSGLSFPLTNYLHEARVISDLWETIITDGAKPEKDREALTRAFDSFGYHNVRKVPELVHRNYLSKFALLDTVQ